MEEPLTQNNVVTCVYCGHEYPDGTPTSQHELLTAHIRVCLKHPMRRAEGRIIRLRNALRAVVGAASKEDLEGMRSTMPLLPIPEAERLTAVTAIDALLAELDEE